MSVQTFWVEPVAIARVLVTSILGENREPCAAPGNYYGHRGEVVIERLPYVVDEEGHTGYVGGHVRVVGERSGIAENDARFPALCTCGAPVVGERSISHEIIYTDGAREYRGLEELPLGAVWRATWYEDWAKNSPKDWRLGPDGMSIAIRTPGGPWHLDQISSNGSFWQRDAIPSEQRVAGTNLRISASPSILIQSGANPYHGWLRDGVLIPC